MEETYIFLSCVITTSTESKDRNTSFTTEHRLSAETDNVRYTVRSARDLVLANSVCTCAHLALFVFRPGVQ